MRAVRSSGRSGGLVLAAVALAVISAGCGSSGDDGRSTAGPTAAGSKRPAMTVVAIGDSDTTGIGDPTGHGWVGRYGDLLHGKVGSRVAVDNRAGEGKTSAELLG